MTACPGPPSWTTQPTVIDRQALVMGGTPSRPLCPDDLDPGDPVERFIMGGPWGSPRATVIDRPAGRAHQSLPTHYPACECAAGSTCRHRRLTGSSRARPAQGLSVACSVSRVGCARSAMRRPSRPARVPVLGYERCMLSLLIRVRLLEWQQKSNSNFHLNWSLI